MSEDGFSLRDSHVAVIGLGLMGGSLAMALRGRCRALTGIDSHLPTLEAVSGKRIVDVATADPAKLAAGVDLVILAVPVHAIVDWLQILPRYIRAACIVLDIGSTKRGIVKAMEALPSNFDPIGGHPICGREQLTFENADADLYQGAPFVIARLARTTARASAAAAQIIEAIGAHLLELTADQHDQILAASSHLPFLLSAALALATPQENAPFVGSGFRSVSRLAGTPASMMLGVLESNRDNISASIRRFRDALSLLESALERPDSEGLEALLDRSRASYQGLVTLPI